MNPQQALATLYQAARLARLTADEHAILQQSQEVLRKAITPKEEPKKDAGK